MSTNDGTEETKQMEMTNLGSSGASDEEAALVKQEDQKSDNAATATATKQGGNKDVDPSTVVGTKEFHSRPQLLKLTFKGVCIGLAPLIFIVVMAIFGVIVYSVAQGEITPAPTMEPTMSPVTTTAKPSMTPSMAPTTIVNGFISRRDMLIDATLADGPNLILDASRDNALNQTQLDRKKGEMLKPNADFDLIDLVRILYLTDGSYDSEILDAINGTVTPFWITINETVQYYWTENHLIMWDSSAYLLQQKFPDLEVNDNVYSRLVAYMQLKIDHGYFALNSAIFAPFKVEALLNLADFSEDTMIKNLAIGALEVLLGEIIDNVNSEGAFYPAQGRGVDRKYSDPTDMFAGSISQINYLLTGLGPTPSQANGFVATTNINNLANILGSYRETIDGEENVYGISIAEFDTFNDQTNYPLTTDDRTVFQLSANLYWIPETVDDTVAFIDKFNLWKHEDFKDWEFFKDPVNAPGIGLTYEELTPFTRGTTLNQITNVLFKDGPSMLSSFKDYNFPYLGLEQYVWAATTGTIAIFSKSGDGSAVGFQNVHLPAVTQTKNVAIIFYDASLMYSTASFLANFGVTDIINVYYHLDENAFDEVREYQNWILMMETGSNGVNGYIGLRRDSNCIYPIINDVITCNQTKQAFSVFVGSSSQYETMDDFQSIIEASTYEETQNRLTIDGITVESGQF